MSVADIQRLRIAVQKSGRLSEPPLELLKKCGIRFTKSKDQLFCQSKNYPLDFLMLRDDDIPELVNEGACDLGIVGMNVYEEKIRQFRDDGRTINMEKLIDLGFGTCRLSIAVPKDLNISDPKQLSSLKIATSYPELLSDYLEENDIKATIVTMSGAIEVAPRLQIADAVCDLVSTGGTLAANGLVEIKTILTSQAILIRRTGTDMEDKEEAIERLMRRVNGVMRADESKYIMLHSPVEALEQVKAAIPGAESPTVVPLQGVEDKVAVHAVCNENVFWETMEDLKAAGANAILVLPIEKMLD